MSGTVLLLDVDGVLQFSRLEFVTALEKDYVWIAGYAAFQSDLFQDPEYLLTLTGQRDFLAVAERILARHAEGLDAETFLKRWLRENIQLNSDFIAKISGLKVDATYLASNQEHLRGNYVERIYSGFPWFGGSFFSCRMGCRKPFEAYFERIISDLGCNPTDCVFVDDSELCVSAAKNVGIRSIHFRNNEDLLSDLSILGIGEGSQRLARTSS